MRHLRLLALGYIVACAGVIVIGCPKPIPVPPPNTDTDAALDSDPDSDFDAIKQDDCARACANMRLPSIQCPEADPPKAGEESCEAVCRHASKSGLTDLKPKCVASARTANEVRACGTVKCKK